MPPPGGVPIAPPGGGPIAPLIPPLLPIPIPPPARAWGWCWREIRLLHFSPLPKRWCALFVGGPRPRKSPRSRNAAGWLRICVGVPRGGWRGRPTAVAYTRGLPKKMGQWCARVPLRHARHTVFFLGAETSAPFPHPGPHHTHQKPYQGFGPGLADAAVFLARPPFAPHRPPKMARAAHQRLSPKTCGSHRARQVPANFAKTTPITRVAAQASIEFWKVRESAA